MGRRECATSTLNWFGAVRASATETGDPQVSYAASCLTPGDAIIIGMTVALYDMARSHLKLDSPGYSERRGNFSLSDQQFQPECGKSQKQVTHNNDALQHARDMAVGQDWHVRY